MSWKSLSASLVHPPPQPNTVNETEKLYTVICYPQEERKRENTKVTIKHFNIYAFWYNPEVEFTAQSLSYLGLIHNIVVNDSSQSLLFHPSPC